MRWSGVDQCLGVRQQPSSSLGDVPTRRSEQDLTSVAFEQGDPQQGLQLLQLSAWLDRGPFTLSLSAGYFGFFAHAGVLHALEERGYRPARLTGASAGAVTGGAWASGLDARSIRDLLFSIRRADFWDPGLGLGLLRGRKFRKLLEERLPARRFEDCRVPLALSTWERAIRGVRVLSSGDLATAIVASCAVPFLFHPVRIGGRRCWDGGIADRAAQAGVAADERVLLHHLPSRRRRPPAALPSTPTRWVMTIPGLPRVSPFRLERGPEAFDVARAQTSSLLAGEGQLLRGPAQVQPVVDRLLRRRQDDLGAGAGSPGEGREGGKDEEDSARSLE